MALIQVQILHPVRKKTHSEHCIVGILKDRNASKILLTNVVSEMHRSRTGFQSDGNTNKADGLIKCGIAWPNRAWLAKLLQLGVELGWEKYNLLVLSCNAKKWWRQKGWWKIFPWHTGYFDYHKVAKGERINIIFGGLIWYRSLDVLTSSSYEAKV